MAKLTKDDLEKIRPFYRGLEGFFILCALVALFGLAIVLFIEPFDPFFIGILGAILLLGHVSGSILFTGYAPSYLLSAHGTRK